MTQPDLTNQTDRVEDDSLTSDPFLCSLVDEFTQLVQKGENPSIEQFVARRPEQAETLRRLLSVARVMASLTSPSHVASSENGGAPEPAADESTQVMKPDDIGRLRDGTDAGGLRGTLGDFRILREIGRGGMGVVYEAEQISLSRRVALKILPFAAMLDERSLQRFRNEARAAASLHHANIVPVFAVGYDRGTHYYAMQYIEGQTIESMIRNLRSRVTPGEHRQSPDRRARRSVARETALIAQRSTQETNLPSDYFREVARLGIQVAEALDYAHQRGIVHRDIKPSNLILDQVRNLWIADFGLARIETENHLTITGDAPGTLRYASPEQALARRGMVDQRSDIFSLGATLYEMLTFQPAFGRTDRNELLRQIVEEDPLPPRSLNRSIPDDLQTIILKSLEKAPQDRYATAKDLAEDLRRFVDDKAILARRLGIHRRIFRLARRHKPIVATALVALTAILCLVSWGTWEQNLRRKEKTRLATAALETLAQHYGDALAKKTDLLAWSESLRASDLARMLVANGPVEQNVGRRVLELCDTVQREATRARIEADDAERDTAMLRACDAAKQAEIGVYIQNRHRPDAPKVFVSGCCDAPNLFLNAFQNYGIDLNLLSEADAARMISESGIREQLVESAILWSLAISKEDMDLVPFKEKLLAIAEAAATVVPAWHQPFVRALRNTDVLKLRSLGIAAGEGQYSVNLLVLLSSVDALSEDYDFLTPLLRVAQQTTPDNFWINVRLAETLRGASPPDLEGVIRYFSIALALRPDSQVDFSLASALEDRGRFDEATAILKEAIRRRPTDYMAYDNLGTLFSRQGRPDESIVAYRQSIQLNPNSSVAHFNFGVELRAQGKLDEAISEFHEAIRLRPDDGGSFRELGIVLDLQGRSAEAIEAYRTAIHFKADTAYLRTHLGRAYQHLDNLDAAISEHREAIRLEPTLAFAHLELGNAFLRKGMPDDAIAAYRESLRLDPEQWRCSYNLGRVLQDQMRLEEAASHYRDVIRLKPDNAEAHCNLGIVLLNVNSFAEGLRELRLAHELGLQDPRWNYPSADWVSEAEELVDLDTRLSEFEQKKRNPDGAAEYLELATFALVRKHSTFLAAQLYRDGFALDSSSGEDPNSGHRYNAACAALLTADSTDPSTEHLSIEDRATWRSCALQWLNSDLQGWRSLAEMTLDARQGIAESLGHWREDPDLASIRESEHLSRLPASEQEQWQQLWSRFDDLMTFLTTAAE